MKAQKTEVMPREKNEMEQVSPEEMAGAVAKTLLPVMQALTQVGQMMEQMMTTMESMHKDIMRQMPLTSAQAGYISAAIRERCDKVIREYALDPKNRTAMSREIRKRLNRAFGVRALKDIPAADYNLALDIVSDWDETPFVQEHM